MSLNKLLVNHRTITAVPILFIVLGLASIAWQANLDLNLWSGSNTPMVTAVTPKPAETSPLAGNNSVLSGLFGSAKSQPTKQPTSLPKTRLKLSISGLFANADGSGQALIAANNKPAKLYRVGDKLPGDAVLESVNPEYVVLSRAGRFEQLPLLLSRVSKNVMHTKERTTAASKTRSADNSLSLSERLQRLRAQKR